jgi:hypothetical protein
MDGILYQVSDDTCITATLDSGDHFPTAKSTYIGLRLECEPAKDLKDPYNPHHLLRLRSTYDRPDGPHMFVGKKRINLVVRLFLSVPM